MEQIKPKIKRAKIMKEILTCTECEKSYKTQKGLTNHKCKPPIKISVADISNFFVTSSRDENDAANKTRERLLKVISNPPAEFLNDPTYGNSWLVVKNAWNEAIDKIALENNIMNYTNAVTITRGGRGYNYDAEIMYYDGSNKLGTLLVEFKYGDEDINGLAQFLSLYAKDEMCLVKYDSFFYDNYLDKYLACDIGLTESKPTKEAYLKNLYGTKYDKTPFIHQLKSRELIMQNEKNSAVNESITDYLNKFGKQLDINKFSEKVKATQTDKIYLLWNNGKFTLDKIRNEEMLNMTYQGIRNGNILEVKSGTTTYSLLLRWRNHKGIMTPAWQISLKRNL